MPTDVMNAARVQIYTLRFHCSIQHTLPPPQPAMQTFLLIINYSTAPGLCVCTAANKNKINSLCNLNCQTAEARFIQHKYQNKSQRVLVRFTEPDQTQMPLLLQVHRFRHNYLLLFCRSLLFRRFNGSYLETGHHQLAAFFRKGYKNPGKLFLADRAEIHQFVNAVVALLQIILLVQHYEISLWQKHLHSVFPLNPC